jgi:hypothetical protein
MLIREDLFIERRELAITPIIFSPDFFQSKNQPVGNVTLDRCESQNAGLSPV